ncbi:hypothetical protein M514_10245 [Trichuris suis]|uniref:Uncharacterized protein n=1 Tax=Trichuris suis TaxID=68888 RepID=A0A085N9R9_9BILA|nr:hypothetical protein M513_10245 [Trichuris suis]KFD66215.1 hypothetical protein M514_10245 [Trichuris suis]
MKIFQGNFIFDHLHHVSTLGHHWEQECFAVTTFYEGSFQRMPLMISISNFIPITISGIAKVLSMLMAAVCLLRVMVRINEGP